MLFERAFEYLEAAVRAQQHVNNALRTTLKEQGGKLTSGRVQNSSHSNELTVMASRRDDPASVVVCAILQKISRLEATDGVAAENETVVSGITAVLEEAAAGAEQAAAEGRAATKGESDAMAYALHACARADANPECMTARVRKALVGGDGVGAVGRRADLMRALPMSRVVRAAQRGLGQLLLAIQAEALESLNQKTVRLLLRRLKHEEQRRRGDQPELEEEEAEEAEAETEEDSAAAAVEAVDGRTPLSPAELEAALAVAATVAALLPACSALGAELGRLARWLRLEVALFERLAKLVSLPPSVSAEDAASARPLASVPAAVSVEEAASAAEHQAVFAGSMRPRAWVLDTTELETEVRATAAAVARSDGRLSVETELLVHGTLPWTSSRRCLRMPRSQSRRAPPDSHALQRLSWR